MNLGAEVVGLRVGILAEPEHAGEGGDAEHLDLLAQVERGLDLHQGGLAGCGLEFVGTGDAGAV